MASASKPLTCFFGEPWGYGPDRTWLSHPRCDEETARACRAFDAAVARGEFDADGYTPKERRAQKRREAKDG
jgi:hypothetical protein